MHIRVPREVMSTVGVPSSRGNCPPALEDREVRPIIVIVLCQYKGVGDIRLHASGKTRDVVNHRCNTPIAHRTVSVVDGFGRCAV